MIRALLLIIAALVFAVFAAANWTPVPLVLGTTEIVIRLPVLLLIVAFLVWLPGSARLRLARRRLRLQAASTQLVTPPPPRPLAVSPAEPIIVPPGGA